jgi:hypothetical protein
LLVGIAYCRTQKVRHVFAPVFFHELRPEVAVLSGNDQIAVTGLVAVWNNGVLVLSPFTDPTCSPRTQAILSKLEPHLQEGDVLRVVPNSYKPSHSDLVIARKHSHLRPQLMEEHWREHMSDLLRSAIGYTY